MEIAPRMVTSRSGNSLAASSEAEYTEAPASLTTIFARSLSPVFQHIADEFVGFAAGRAVTNGNQLHLVF